MKKGVLCIVFTMFAVTLMGIYKFQSEHRKIAEVSTVKAQRSPVYDYVIMHGRVKERARYDVYTDCTASVVKTLVSVGDEVVKGQALVTVEMCDVANQTEYEEIRQAVSNIIGQLLSGNTVQSSSALQSTVSLDIFGEYQILSPCNGTVMGINCDEGDMVGPSYPVAVISDLSDLEVEAKVEEDLISQIKTGMTCTVSVDALNAFSVSGKIETIMPYADTSVSLTGASDVRTTVLVALNRYASQKILPGYSAAVNVITERRDDVVLVPYEAVGQDANDKEYVLIFKEGKLEKRFITTGKELNDSVEVTDGLIGNEDMIAEPDKLNKVDRVIVS